MSKSKITASIITIGNQAVGKTAISKRFSNDEFDELYSATIGIDFFSKTVKRDGEDISVKIWDSTGQERFMTITKQYIKRAEGILVVFDVTDRASFEKLDMWLSQITDQTREQKSLWLLLETNATSKATEPLVRLKLKTMPHQKG